MFMKCEEKHNVCKKFTNRCFISYNFTFSITAFACEKYKK